MMMISRLCARLAARGRFTKTFDLNLYIGGPISTNVCRKFWIADLTLSTIVCRAEVPDVMQSRLCPRHIWDANTYDIRLH